MLTVLVTKNNNYDNNNEAFWGAYFVRIGENSFSQISYSWSFLSSNLKVSNATFAYTRRRQQTHLIPKVNGITFIINTVFLGDTPADVKPA